MLTVNDQFNLLLSCRRWQEVESCQELRRIVEEDATLASLEWCKITGITCLVAARVEEDAHEFITKFSKVVRRAPWMVRQLLKLQPVDLVVASNLSAIRKGAKKIATRIPKEAKFSVNLARRDTRLDRNTLLHEVATQFPGKVDLERYEWIIAVEMLGPITGLAVLKEDEIVTMRKP